MTATDPISAARREIKALEAAGARVLVLLSNLGKDDTETLLTKVKGFHFAVEGGELHETARPIIAGGAILVGVPYAIQKLALFRNRIRSPGLPWKALITPAQVAAMAKTQLKQAATYLRQAESFAKQGKAFAKVAAIYRKKAEDLRRSAKRIKKKYKAGQKLPLGKNGYVFEFLIIGDKVPKDPKVERRITRLGGARKAPKAGKK